MRKDFQCDGWSLPHNLSPSDIIPIGRTHVEGAGGPEMNILTWPKAPSSALCLQTNLSHCPVWMNPKEQCIQTSDCLKVSYYFQWHSDVRACHYVYSSSAYYSYRLTETNVASFTGLKEESHWILLLTRVLEEEVMMWWVNDAEPTNGVWNFQIIAERLFPRPKEQPVSYCLGFLPSVSPVGNLSTTFSVCHLWMHPLKL